MIDPLPIYTEPDIPELNCLTGIPSQMAHYPRFRYMGSKFRLTGWMHGVFQQLDFHSACDAFAGSGVVSYLLKSMGKSVLSNDSLCFPSVLSRALIQNNETRLSEEDVVELLGARAKGEPERFIQRTFDGIFYDKADLGFLDDVWSGVRRMDCPAKRAIAVSALLRSSIKRQPRGVFTVAGDPEKYKDGRRDLQLSLREHFLEQVDAYNAAVFCNARSNTSCHGDVFACPAEDIDLVYMDPPYVPRSDDNCYVKRYHFLEGLSCYWQGMEILETSKVRKIKKPYTPFGYRSKAVEAFDRMFAHFAESHLVLSYSSNAFPDLDILVGIMGRYKKNVEVLRKPHRYHFGTHATAQRNEVEEYLILGTS